MDSVNFEGSDWLKGKRVVVTGANRGLGAAMAKAFVAAGAQVLVHARTDASAEAARTASGAAAAVAGELADPGLGARIVAAAASLGGINALVLNAGVLGERKELAAIDVRLFGEVMDVNVDAQVRLLVAALPALLAARGTVVWLTSGVGRFGIPGYGAYCASKHAVEGLNKLAHAEYGARGLVSVAVAPGMVQTDMLRAALQTDDVSRYPLPEVAAAGFVRLLATADARRAELGGASVDIADF